jgi:hypothetical protein
VNSCSSLPVIAVPTSAGCSKCANALVFVCSLRPAHWYESIAVGSERFTREVKTRLGVAARHRATVPTEDSYALREPSMAYTGRFDPEMAPLSTKNTRFWNMNAGASDG